MYYKRANMSNVSKGLTAGSIGLGAYALTRLLGGNKWLSAALGLGSGLGSGYLMFKDQIDGGVRAIVDKFRRSKAPGSAGAEEGAAKMMLESLALALRIHSDQTGGGGNANFAKDLSQVSGLYAKKITPAMPNSNGNFKGYRVLDYRVTDNGNNFKITVGPADGFSGDSWCITKDEKPVKVESSR